MGTEGMSIEIKDSQGDGDDDDDLDLTIDQHHGRDPEGPSTRGNCRTPPSESDAESIRYLRCQISAKQSQNALLHKWFEEVIRRVKELEQQVCTLKELLDNRNQLGPTRDMYYQVKLDDLKIAKENILQLFYHFAGLDKKPEDEPRKRSLITLGVCFKLSASRPNTDERKSVGEALDQLLSSLNSALAESHTTNDQRNFITPLQRQFRKIVGGPDFVKLTSETLFQKLLGVFIAKNSLAQQEVLDSLPNKSLFPRLPTREEVGTELDLCFPESCYAKQYTNSDWCVKASTLITECLKFSYVDKEPYGLEMTPIESPGREARRDEIYKLLIDGWDEPIEDHD